MIQNIHEITAAHEDEIYATPKDRFMDPNETAQRLLNQDTGGRNSSIGKENTSNQASEKSAGLSSSSAPLEPKKNEATAATSFASAITNGPSFIVAKGTKADVSKLGGPAPQTHLNIVKPGEFLGQPGQGRSMGRSPPSRVTAQLLTNFK